MESLGYLHVKHTLQHGTYDSVFRPAFMKYVKYEESNTYDLNKLKLTSLTEENFEQIENFVEYESYLKLSYFSHVQREVNQQFHILKNSTSSSAEFFSDLVFVDTNKLTRTSDLKVVLPKYSFAQKLPQKKLPGENVVTFADKIYEVVVKGDDLLASYKYTRYNNYKEGLYNCLVEYEDTKALQLKFDLNQVVANLFNKKEIDLQSIKSPDLRFIASVKLGVTLIKSEKIDIDRDAALV